MDVLAKLKPSTLRKIIQTTSRDDLPSAVESCSATAEDGSSFNTRVEVVDGEPMSTSASLSHSYSLEWQNLFTKQNVMEKLKERAMEGNLRSSRFRSVAWRIFLKVLPLDMNEWIERTQKSRNKYEEMKNRLIVNPRRAVDSVDITLNNPLSQDEESPWNKFFQDNELRLTIKQDVIRTYPKIEFFQSNQLRNLMVDILFIFAKENADVSYQQGMHELLAPLIFVLHCDHQAFLHACEIDTNLKVMKEVLDPTYLEHDAYTMFCQVMETVEPWYLSRDIFNNQSKSGSVRSLNLINAIPFSKSQDLNPSSAIATKLTRIQDHILKMVDPELHLHLERLEIVPQIYGIRWLRLLFGREFPMQDLLMLWDAIFGDGITFDLVDYIFVAMLFYLRDVLLTSDYTVCLTALMKFPPVADVHYFVAKALWIREPNLHPQPPTYIHQGSIRISNSMDSSPENISSDGGIRESGKYQHHGQSHKRPNNMLGGFSSFSRKFSRPRTLSVPKSSSEPMNLQTDVSPDPAGSTVSLSHVEESMFRHNRLASSLAQLESSHLRSAQSSPGVHQSAMFPLTPDDVSISSSPPKYNSLPGKSGNQQKMSRVERELREISRLQGELSEKNSMCRYCSSKLDVHIGRLQQDLSRQNFPVDEDIMMSLAGLKLVRDILNGTVTFSHISIDDEDIQTSDDYYGSQDGGGDNCSTGITSPESDILLSTASCGGADLELSEQQRLKLCNEEASLPDFLPPEAQTGSSSSRIKGSNVVELNDFHNLQKSNIITSNTIVENINTGERISSAENNISSDISDGKDAQSSGHFTSKFLRMFKTDFFSDSHSRSTAQKTSVQKSVASTGEAALTSKAHNDDCSSSFTLPSGNYPVGTNAKPTSHHRNSKVEQFGRELTTVDSKWRAEFNTKNQSD